ncbi:MAG: hypothetical protein JST16_09035 [Bdellovibrionales bacterium]|nr:hypothetical protein [Bdellovibrionales bacterium]
MKTKFSLLLTLALSFVGFAAHAQVEVSTEAEQLKQSIEGKIQRTLDTYLGGKSKVIVNVRFRAPTAKEDDAVANIDTWMDLGYVTAPNEGVASNKIRFKAAEVDIRVSDQLDDATVQQIQLLANNALDGMNPDVKISRVAFLEPDALQAANGATPGKAADRTPASVTPEEPKSEVSVFEKLIQKYGALIPLAAALVLGLGLLLSSSIASTVISRSAGEIAAGIRSMRATVSSNPEKPLTVAAPLGLDIKSSEVSAAKAPPVAPRLREHFKNLAFVKKTLLENPLAFVRVLGDSPEDQRGLKWLLANLDDAERASLKSVLGRERILTLTQAINVEGPWDPASWLQGTVENAVLREVAGTSVVERALEGDQAFRLSMAPVEDLFQAVEESNDPASWRVALEFLPREKIGVVLRASDSSVWQRMLAGSDLDRDALRQAAGRILDRVGQNARDPRTAVQAEDKRRFYANILLDPAIDSILAKTLGEDDQFLDDLATMAPDFVALLRTKVWTPRSLDAVDHEALREAFLPLSPAQKMSVMLALPATVSQRFEDFLPEGTGRTIVLDQLRRARERQDLQEFDAATRLAREFLDYLRKQADSGRLALRKASTELPPVSGEGDEEQAA